MKIFNVMAAEKIINEVIINEDKCDEGIMKCNDDEAKEASSVTNVRN